MSKGVQKAIDTVRASDAAQLAGKKRSSSQRALELIESWFSENESTIDLGRERGSMPAAVKTSFAQELSLQPLLLSKAWQVVRRSRLNVLDADVLDKVRCGKLSINTVYANASALQKKGAQRDKTRLSGQRSTATHQSKVASARRHDPLVSILPMLQNLNALLHQTVGAIEALKTTTEDHERVQKFLEKVHPSIKQAATESFGLLTYFTY